MPHTDAAGPGRLRFGVFELDARSGELRKRGERVRLSGQPVRILEMLLQRRGDIVTRDELRHELWPADTFVDFEHNLNSAVKRLRAALGDSAETPRFVETLPRRGYRFLAPVEVVDSPAASEVPKDSASPAPVPAPPPASTARAHPRIPLLSLLVGASAAAVLIGVVWPGVWSNRARPVRSIAVLPFTNLSNDPDQEYVSDGMTEALITALSRIDGLRVTSRTSASQYRGASKPASQIARELSVDGVVEGSVQREGDRIRVTAQLINGASDTHLWAEAFERRMESVLDLQRELAAAIAAEIRVGLAPDLPARITAERQIPVEAIHLYLRGRHLLNRRTQPELVSALENFERALTLDPNYAQAHLGIALVWEAQSSWATFVAPRIGFPKAREAAQKALSLDETLAEAHTILAFIADVYEWNLEAAERGYKRALELSPSNALAVHRYALHLRRRGRFEEALAMAKRGHALDPLSLEANVQVGLNLQLAGQLDAAIEQMLRTIELDRTYYDTYVHLAEMYEEKGSVPEAISTARRSVELAGGSAHAVQALVRSYIGSGDHTEARRLLEELEQRPAQRDAYEIALLRLRLGDTHEMLSWLERACEERAPQMAFLHMRMSNTLFDAVRADQRFEAIVDCTHRAP